MRVLQIIDNISKDSGVSSFIMSVYRNIDKSKIQFDFLVANEKENSFEQEILALGGKVIYFGNPLSPRSLIRSQRRIKKILCEIIDDYEAFHLHTPTMAAFTLRHVKALGGVHRIVHSHSSMTSTSVVKAVFNSILMQFVKVYSNHFWACSKEAANFLFGNRFCEKHTVFFAANAVDVSFYSPNESLRTTMRENNCFSDRVVCIHVSNFTTIKNTSFLVKVMKHMSKVTLERIHFLFVGDGSQKEELVKELQEEKLDSYCTFSGKVTDTVSYYNAADVLLLPSIKEGLPVTVIEAQSVGIPCIVSSSITRECDVGNVSFLDLDPELWARKIEQVSIQTVVERRENADYLRDSRFNIRNSVKEIENEYLKMIGANGT